MTVHDCGIGNETVPACYVTRLALRWRLLILCRGLLAILRWRLLVFSRRLLVLGRRLLPVDRWRRALTVRAALGSVGAGIQALTGNILLACGTGALLTYQRFTGGRAEHVALTGAHIPDQVRAGLLDCLAGHFRRNLGPRLLNCFGTDFGKLVVSEFRTRNTGPILQ